MHRMNNNLTTDVQLAAQLLRDGKLVAFPTETVYGLGADARNPIAIKKVFAAKGRPADHPLIVHLGNHEQIAEWAIDIPPTAWALAKHFWPGPLTIVLSKHPSVSPLITGGQDTVALRIPNHHLTLELLKQFGSGLVGPSANKYGRVSPTMAEHVALDLGSEVAAILDGGPCQIGIESTIVYLSKNQPLIMRQGAITAQQIAEVLDTAVALKPQDNISVRTSGSHISHYAPRTPVYLLSTTELLASINSYQMHHKLCSVISFMPKPKNLSRDIYWQQISQEPVVYAQQLYANLRAHDLLNNAAILIEQVPDNLEWVAILDRLTRASFK